MDPETERLERNLTRSLKDKLLLNEDNTSDKCSDGDEVSSSLELKDTRKTKGSEVLDQATTKFTQGTFTDEKISSLEHKNISKEIEENVIEPRDMINSLDVHNTMVVLPESNEKEPSLVSEVQSLTETSSKLPASQTTQDDNSHDKIISASKHQNGSESSRTLHTSSTLETKADDVDLKSSETKSGIKQMNIVEDILENKATDCNVKETTLKNKTEAELNNSSKVKTKTETLLGETSSVETNGMISRPFDGLAMKSSESVKQENMEQEKTVPEFQNRNNITDCVFPDEVEQEGVHQVAEEIESTSASAPEDMDLNDIKEPEEPDHKAECHLLHEENKVEESTDGQDSSAAADGWTYVLGHDKLKKRVIRPGSKDTRPLRGQVVTVNCVGHLENGTEVDKHDNLSLTLGDGDFIHAFDLCVALMDKGEKCEVVTEGRFAYGELGRSPDIPPNATISYEIELIDYCSHPEYSTMTITERIKLSDEKRERGNYLYSRNEFSRSIDLYTRAMKALDEDFESHGESPEELQQLIDTRVKCHNNMAAAQMKVHAWDAASSSCDAVLKVQPENVKALFRKGKCLANKGDVSAAIQLLKQALKLEPETKIIHQELSRLEKLNKAQMETEKVLYKKMLGTDKQPQHNKQKEEKSSKWLWYAAGGIAAVLVSLGLTAYRYVHI